MKRGFMNSNVARLKSELVKAWKELETAKLKAIQAERRAVEAEATERMLRSALSSLGSRQGIALFAKNRDRQFIFANNVLLKGLVPLAKTNSSLVRDGHIRWEDVYLKTDRQLQIDCEDYIKSDDLILSGKVHHFEGFEKSFDLNAPEGSVIWTRKEPIRDGNRIIGVVGYVVPGLPMEIQKLTNQLFAKAPIYASIKNDKGYVIWANERHLRKLAPRINELLKRQKLTKYLKYPLQARLRAINDNQGPTDEDLYGVDGLQYRQRDQEIMACARAHTGDEQSFEVTMDELIQRWEKQEHEGHYPDKGWMEFHRFPGERNRRWVEVWKMPWWEETAERVQRSWRVKGVLVFFQDRHKHFLRKSVIWRWIETHLKHANEGSVRMLESALRQGTFRAEQLPRLSAFGLPRMLRRMLIWFKAFVDDTQDKVRFKQRRRTTNDLSLLLRAVQESYSNEVTIRYYPPNPHITFESYGDDLFAIIIAVTMNAVEATIATRLERPPVIVRIHVEQRTVIASVLDDAECPSPEKLNRINFLRALNNAGEPGGGFFLAKRLAAHLATSATTCSVPEETLLIQKARASRGAEVLIRLPYSVFDAR